MERRLAPHLELASLSDEEFVAHAYRIVLRRDADAPGRDRALRQLGEGTLSRATLLAELTSSAEFASLRALDDGVAFAGGARARGERPRLLRAPRESDERAIEIPWTLARYRGERRVLDVGYAFAEPAYVAALIAACPAEPVGVDLAEASIPGLRSVVGDIRRLPFDGASFDVVFCISTLEHIGRDNRAYGGAAEADEGGIAAALAELRRVLASDGRAFVTVPCGAREDHGAFLQLEPSGWLELFVNSGFLVFEHEVYVRGDEGWRSDDATEAVTARYGEAGSGAAAVLCAELRRRTLRELARGRLRRLRGAGADPR